MRAAPVVCGAVVPRRRPVVGLPVRLVIKFDQVFPQRDLRYLKGRHPVRIVLLPIHRAIIFQRVRDGRNYFRIVRIVARDHVDALVFFQFAVDPQAEPGQRRSDRRHRESDAFQRSIPPRLVIGREYRHVHAAQQFVVVFVENPVVSVQIRRHEHQLYRTRRVHQAGIFDPADDRVPLRSRKIMRRIAQHVRIDRVVRIVQVRLQVFARPVVPGRHGHVGQHRTLQRIVFGELQQRIDEHVQSLVLKLVTPAGSDDQRFAVVFDAEAGFGDFDHRLARRSAFLEQLGLFPDNVVLEAVRRNDVDLFAEQIAALARRQVTDRRETVEIGGRRLFQRMFGNHVEPPRQFVGVQPRHIAVQRQSVAGDTTPHDRRMGGKYRGDVRRMFL